MSVKLWAYGTFVIGTIDVFARSLQLLPRNDLAHKGIASELDVPYVADGSDAHMLDIYMPTTAPRPWPVAVYVHGGGFKYFDKASHWAAAAKFAEAGYLTFNVNYRLAPKHPYPAAVEDVAAALEWIAANAGRYGGDVSRLVLSGESAGGNLTLGAAIAASWKRPERFAQRVWDTGLRPRVLLPACGYLAVANPQRHAENHDMPAWMNGRILQVSSAYLPDHAQPKPEHAFANPLHMLRELGAPDRPFPATFAIVGDADPVQDDTIALGNLLRERGIRGGHRVYPKGFHAFHAATWTQLAKTAWDDQLAFLDAHMPAG